jgi:hypothetical protein
MTEIQRFFESAKPFSKKDNNVGVYLLFRYQYNPQSSHEHLAEIVYIGQSKDVYNRLKIHRDDKDFDFVRVISMPNESERYRVERLLINELLPSYNKDAWTSIMKEQKRVDLLNLKFINQ